MSFEVTDIARKRVKEMLIKNDKDCLRIKVTVGGCSGFHYEIEFANEIDSKVDEVFNFGETPEDKVAIVIDRKSSAFLNETTLDYIMSLRANSFKFVNSKAKRTCGCGESFGV